MRQTVFFAAVCLLLLPTSLAAQEPLPADITVPVMLTSSLSSEPHAEQTVTARVMQAVAAGPNLVIPAGSRVVGRVLETKPSSSQGSQLSLRFDRIIAKNRQFVTALSLRAIASHVEVNDAQIPKAGPDEGTSSYSWTTVQVGGDVRYGTGWPVMAGESEVGKGVPDGVLARLSAAAGPECTEGPNTNQLQSLWVFSSSACGVYGFPDVAIQHSGRTAPLGEIVLVSQGKVLKLPSGTGLLLQVAGDPAVTRIWIDTVPDEYWPVNVPIREPVSMRDFHFEVNEETVRARVVVEYTYPDELVYGPDDDGRGPQPTVAQISGLNYDPVTRTVVYEGDEKRTVCANLAEHKGIFGRRLRIRNTGSCLVIAEDLEHREDDGWAIRRYRAIDTYFEVR